MSNKNDLNVYCVDNSNYQRVDFLEMLPFPCISGFSEFDSTLDCVMLDFIQKTA